jgi:Ser/Thr protein kinase RdoA (MazF antagonist)
MSDNASLEQLHVLAAKALQEWGIEDAELDLIKHRENAVYGVTNGSDTRYALRVHRYNYHTDDELRSELQWMDALDEYGVHTPSIIPASDGQMFKVVATDDVPHGRQCDLLAWVDGKPLGSIEGDGEADPEVLKSSYYTVGKLMAKLHNHAAEWILPDGFTRHAWDIDGITGENPFWGRYWELDALTPAQSDLLIAAAEIVRHKLEAFGSGSDRYGMIHADFLPENLLADGDNLNLIDFDDAGFGWHLFDIATSVFFLLGEEFFDDVLQALIDGYRTERELTDEHLETLPTLLMARGLTYVGWIHTRRETETAKELTPVVVEGVCALAEDYCS